MVIPVVLILWMRSILYTDALVTLEVKGGLHNSSTLICQQNASIVCKIDNYTNYMSLEIGSSVVFECAGIACAPINSPPPNILVSGDTTTGLFSFSLSPVLKSDNGRLFKCSDHQSFKDLRVSVEAFTVTTTSDNTSIQVTAGCVANESEVEFHWFTTNVTFGDEQPYMPTNVLTTNTSCSNDLMCGNNNTSRYTKKFVIGQNGKTDRYIKAVINYRRLNYNEPIFSSRTFTIGDTTTLSTTTTTTTPSFTSSPTENITSSNTSETSMTTKQATQGIQQTKTADNTLTILIASFSLIAGIVLLLVIVFAYNKCRKKRMRQPEPTNMRAINPNIILNKPDK